TSSNIHLPAFIAVTPTTSTISSPSVTDYVIVYRGVYTKICAVINSGNQFTVSNIDSSSKTKLNNQEDYYLLIDLGKGLAARNKDVDSQIAKIISDNFWDLI